MLRCLFIFLLLPFISASKGIEERQTIIDDSTSLIRLIFLADSIYIEDMWRAGYPDLYLEIEKNYLTNTELNNTLKNDLKYKLADFFKQGFCARL